MLKRNFALNYPSMSIPLSPRPIPPPATPNVMYNALWKNLKVRYFWDQAKWTHFEKKLLRAARSTNPQTLENSCIMNIIYIIIVAVVVVVIFIVILSICDHFALVPTGIGQSPNIWPVYNSAFVIPTKCLQPTKFLTQHFQHIESPIDIKVFLYAGH